MSLICKIYNGSETRRRTLPQPVLFRDLRAAVTEMGAAPNEKLYYRDADNDWITLTSDEELIEAQRCSKTPNVLHLALGMAGQKGNHGLKDLTESEFRFSQQPQQPQPSKTLPAPKLVQPQPAQPHSPSTSTFPSLSTPPQTPVSNPQALLAESLRSPDFQKLLESTIQQAVKETLARDSELRKLAIAREDERETLAAQREHADKPKQECPYGLQCYENGANKDHMALFEHPPKPAEKQKCPYGEKCYRQNSKHHELFYHEKVQPKSPVPPSVDTAFDSAKPLFASFAQFAAKDVQQQQQQQQQQPPATTSPDSPVADVSGRDSPPPAYHVSPTPDFGALFAPMAAKLDLATALPVVLAFLRRPNDASSELALHDLLLPHCEQQTNGGLLISSALRYVKQRPHVREFLLQLASSPALPTLLAQRTAPAAAGDSLSASVLLGDATLIASFRDDTAAGRIVCDGCRKVITGDRYKCTSCADFDLCARCEADSTHEPAHALLKIKPLPRAAGPDAFAALDDAIKNPTSAKVASTASNESDTSSTNNDAPPSIVYGSLGDAAPSAALPTGTIYSDLSGSRSDPHRRCVLRAKKVADVTLADNTAVAPGARMHKVWRLQNTGDTVWPSGIRALNVGGSDFNAEPVRVGTVIPGATVDVAVDCTAPLVDGRLQRFTGYWRLHDASGNAFGERFWLDVVVDPSLLYTTNELELEREQLANKKREDEQRARQEREEAMLQEQYRLREQLSNEASKHRYADKAQQLVAMGFGNKETNLQLLEKYDGSVIDTVNYLIAAYGD